MNMNPVMEALDKVTGLPVEQDKYTGVEHEWITYNYVVEQRADYADDKPTSEITYMQVHLFTKKDTDYMNTKDVLRDYLERKGFDDISIETILDDTDMRETIFDCSMKIQIND